MLTNAARRYAHYVGWQGSDGSSALGRLLLWVVATVGLVACQTKPLPGKCGAPFSRLTPPAHSRRISSIPAEARIELIRGQCYSMPCPIDQMVIRGDGRFWYYSQSSSYGVSERHNWDAYARWAFGTPRRPLSGMWLGQADPDVLREVFRLAQTAQARQAIPHRHRRGIRHLATHEIFLSIGNYHKAFYNYGCGPGSSCAPPAPVLRLENAADLLLKSAALTKIARPFEEEIEACDQLSALRLQECKRLLGMQSHNFCRDLSRWMNIAEYREAKWSGLIDNLEGESCRARLAALEARLPNSWLSRTPNAPPRCRQLSSRVQRRCVNNRPASKIDEMACAETASGLLYLPQFVSSKWTQQCAGLDQQLDRRLRTETRDSESRSEEVGSAIASRDQALRINLDRRLKPGDIFTGSDRKQVVDQTQSSVAHEPPKTRVRRSGFTINYRAVVETGKDGTLQARLTVRELQSKPESHGYVPLVKPGTEIILTPGTDTPGRRTDGKKLSAAAQKIFLEMGLTADLGGLKQPTPASQYGLDQPRRLGERWWGLPLPGTKSRPLLHLAARTDDDLRLDLLHQASQNGKNEHGATSYHTRTYSRASTPIDVEDRVSVELERSRVQEWSSKEMSTNGELQDVRRKWSSWTYSSRSALDPKRQTPP